MTPAVTLTPAAFSAAGAGRGSGSQERRLANGRAIVAYLGRSRYRLTGVELSRVLGLSQPAVSLAAQRGQRLLAQHDDLRVRLTEI
ncbi:MAG: hypothetical protein ACOYXU_03615 [Nitrospirota bacterium]